MPPWPKLVPLRPINSTEEHDRAIAQLNSLIDRHSELTPGEIDYMDVLGLIVGHYEDALYGEPADDPGDDEGEGEGRVRKIDGEGPAPDAVPTPDRDSVPLTSNRRGRPNGLPRRNPRSILIRGGSW